MLVQKQSKRLFIKTDRLSQKGIAENRLALIEAWFPVMTFEGNMGDEHEFDEARTIARIDSFMEIHEVDKSREEVA